RFDVTTVGEASLRLSVPTGDRLALANSLDLHVAGTEANVTGALAQLGHRCGWVSALPKSPLGERATNAFAFSGLDTSAVNWVEGGRMATLFVEYASAPRPTQVYYDRKNSSFTKISSAEIDWNYLLNTRLIHLTGITVALSESCRELVSEVIRRAKSAEIPISFDINYRSKLWDVEKAVSVLEPMIAGIDLLFCSKRDAEAVFGCVGSAEKILIQLDTRFGAKHIVMSNGRDGVYGLASGQMCHAPAVEVDIVDRIGAGDAMAAGVIHGWLGGDFAQGVQFGALAAACAMSQAGDMLVLSREELHRLSSNRNAQLIR
ncbi:MAG: sugar kinase, partial [Chloroflexota bacterium]